jgi:DNA-binding MarR family transcriptional regulator
MTSVNGLSGNIDTEIAGLHVAALLGLVLRRLRLEILEDSEAAFPGLRVSHFRLLELIPADGARITDLAEAAGMTKQGLGQHVDYLQGLGFTESDRLQDDRRVRLVRRTAKGNEAVDFSRRAIARVERTWEEQLGAERYAALREALLDLGAQPAR